MGNPGTSPTTPDPTLPSSFTEELSCIIFKQAPSVLLSTGPNGLNASDPLYAGMYTEWLQRTQGAPPNQGLSVAPGISNDNTFFTQVKNLFGTWDPFQPDPAQRKVMPRTLADFITQFRSYFGITSASFLNPLDPSAGPIRSGLQDEFAATLQTTPDWNALAGTVDAGIEATKAFDAFLQDFTFDKAEFPSGSGNFIFSTPDLAIFLTKWSQFSTVTALHDPANATGAYANMASYKAIFKAFFPNATDDDFKTSLNNFVESVEADKTDGGYFVPSQYLGRFLSETEKAFALSQPGILAVGSSGEPTLAIIWKLFALLVDMIQTIQKAAGILAQRLTYLTNYQKAYTTLIGSIPTFTANKPFADPTALNQQNNTYAENLRSYRDLVTSDSEALQSNVDALNESVNQQSNLCTALLQQMQTILTSIWR